MDNSKLDPEPPFSTIGKSNNNELVKPVVLEGLNSDDARNNYLTLIHAIQASDVDNVNLLLKNNCIVNKPDVNMFDLLLHHAIEAGNLQIIELLLNAGASLLTIATEKTPLYKAMKNQQFDVVDLMLSKYNTANIDPKNKQAFVHFVIACIRNNGNLVQQFIHKGIDVNGVLDDYADEWTGHTPLSLSVKYLSVEVVKILLKHQADFTFQDKNGNSPLHLAYYTWKSRNTDTNKNEKASDIMDLILAAHTKNINNVVNHEYLSHFHIACMGRHATSVYYFLQSGVDVNSRVFMARESSAAEIPLHLAVEHCRTDIVKILLEHEADVNARNSNGLTSLDIALQSKLFKIAELLLEFKAVLNTAYRECYDTILQVFSGNPKTDRKIVMMFLACQGNLVNSVNEDGLSLLHVACTRNNISVIKKLLLTTADVNACVHKNSSEWAGYTALHFAASTQNLDAIHVLLEYQADVNVVEGRGLTPLWLSLEAQPKYTEIKNIINNKYKNEIKIISKEQEKTIKSILEADFKYENEVAGIISKETIEDKKLVKITESLLPEFENTKVVELLVKSKSNLNHKNNSGDPLLFAVYKSFVNCVVNQVEKDKISEVIISKLCSNYYLDTAAKIMNCLMKYGIDPNICDSKNNHIFHIIAHSASYNKCTMKSDCSHYNCGSIQCRRLSVKIAKIILENGANVNVFDNAGSTPLHLAIGSACAKLVKLFLQFDADVDVPDDNRSTPLHLAVTNILIEESIGHLFPPVYASDYVNFEKILDCLFGSNCNVNARDAKGRTPLHIAAINRHAYCIVRLLENGADINIKDSRNESSFDVLYLNGEYLDYDTGYFLECAFESLLMHVLKLLLIDHPVEPSYFIRCEPVGDGKILKFFYRYISIREEEDHSSKFYNHDIFICEQDNTTYVPHNCNFKLRGEVAKLRDEVAKLKDAKIDRRNSLFDILGKNLRQMMILARNEALKEQICSENLGTKFPNYAYLLKLKFKDGSTRNAILEQAHESLRRYVSRTILHDICVDHIFSYISNNDLKNLVLAAK